uniref:Uncharacterized protein MANES_12G050000 n=1 Tax=Rhizophora mucronata TaxID=61149 RepID=A0A2P2ISD2_RHIMU
MHISKFSQLNCIMTNTTGGSSN